MLQTNQILTTSIQSELYPFQVEKITRQVNDFILSNKESQEYSFILYHRKSLLSIIF